MSLSKIILPNITVKISQLMIYSLLKQKNAHIESRPTLLSDLVSDTFRPIYRPPSVRGRMTVGLGSVSANTADVHLLCPEFLYSWSFLVKKTQIGTNELKRKPVYNFTAPF